MIRLILLFGFKSSFSLRRNGGIVVPYIYIYIYTHTHKHTRVCVQWNILLAI
jgi:hypothetical protein